MSTTKTPHPSNTQLGKWETDEEETKKIEEKKAEKLKDIDHSSRDLKKYPS